MDFSEYRQFHFKITEKLVKAREEAGLTQNAVAQTGILSQSEISKIENGQRYIDFITLILLAKLYGKDVNYFVPPEN
ncbi:helix-turn-helix domain-containing protein [Larkinella bovis]|uniref:Helix-turn-helix domain-containing protein n=1 Tax=Larkinella bovis TaxID=683041 RepID=A0ABW0IPT2_9BACT